jgi:hypothetical protein
MTLLLHLGIYSKECKSPHKKDICTATFIAALFTTAHNSQAYVSNDGWMDKEYVVHIHNGVLYTHKEWLLMGGGFLLGEWK